MSIRPTVPIVRQGVRCVAAGKVADCSRPCVPFPPRRPFRDAPSPPRFRAISSSTRALHSPNVPNAGPRRGSSSDETSRGKPHRYRKGYIPLSFLILPPVFYYLYQSIRGDDTLSPYSYTDHTVAGTRKLTPTHLEVAVPLDQGSRELFGHPELVAAGPSRSGVLDGKVDGADRFVTVHHVMVKNPDLMIERPYTPVNDIEADGKARLVVKRVKGGEVGRMIHSLQDGHKVGLRGPIPTFTIDPSAYDRIIMVSSGTGAAPFLQLLAKLPSGAPQLHLIHAKPKGSDVDWIADSDLLPALEKKHGSNLRLSRTPHGALQRDVIAEAVKRTAGERIMVLACLPPDLMRELCGNLTAMLHQGELTGMLRDLGLSKTEVWKLE